MGVPYMVHGDDSSNIGILLDYIGDGLKVELLTIHGAFHSHGGTPIAEWFLWEIPILNG